MYSPLTVDQARDARDTLAKRMYENLFSWLVHKMNIILAEKIPSDAADTDAASWTSVGVLDIFGFENFAHNSFEQLCINTANEQLHHYFNQHIFAWELDEYKKEGIQASDITFKDNNNQVCVALVCFSNARVCLLWYTIGVYSHITLQTLQIV